jgi:hypothetical protein
MDIFTAVGLLFGIIGIPGSILGILDIGRRIKTQKSELQRMDENLKFSVGRTKSDRVILDFKWKRMT